jgi:hypothetical protein
LDELLAEHKMFACQTETPAILLPSAGNLTRVLALNGIFEIIDTFTEAALVSNG